jgi:hypothetical protein
LFDIQFHCIFIFINQIDMQDQLAVSTVSALTTPDAPAVSTRDSSPSAAKDEFEAWVRLGLSRRARALSPDELERLCKTLRRLQPAAASALAEAEALNEAPEAKAQALDPLSFLLTLRGLTS